MRALKNMADRAAGIGLHVSIGVHDASPAIAGEAQRLAELVPAAWHPNVDGRGWINATLRVDFVTTVTITVFGVAEPAGWVDAGPLARGYAQKVAGHLIESHAEADETVPSVPRLNRRTAETIPPPVVEAV